MTILSAVLIKLVVRWLTQSMTCPECRSHIQYHDINKVRTLGVLSTKVYTYAIKAYRQFAQLSLLKDEALEREERRVKEERLCTSLRQGREIGWETQAIPPHMARYPG